MNRCVAGGLLAALILTAVPVKSGAQTRRSPVSYHMSFDNRDFFEQDFIERSGKVTLQDRKIDFPDGQYGKGIRMSFVPDPPDQTNMTGIDLDLITAVIFNTRPGNQMGYNQPFIWGSGRLNPRLGAVSFWAKGKPPFACPLFEQTTIAFGRKERDLLGVVVDENLMLSAYVRDARYVYHRLPAQFRWDPNKWNHVVFNWDWANGLELWLNGTKVGTSWGNDGWFETLLPGLFHLAAPGLTYDELYLLDRPLTEQEINRLMTDNEPPADESPVYERKNIDVNRLDTLSGAVMNKGLPAVTPDDGLTVREVFPTDAADGHVPGWYVIDGRNEIAWPHEYAFFTIIPGDADFHAEKVDITTPADSRVNYVTLSGNLANVTALADHGDMSGAQEIASVPDLGQFNYGTSIATVEGATFRIPFTESYGPPPGFEGKTVKLPRSGDKRIQNVGLYYITAGMDEPTGERMPIAMMTDELDGRYGFAVHALTARDERRIALAAPGKHGKGGDYGIGGFSRLHIMTRPYDTPTGITRATIEIPLKTERPVETLFVRVHDSAVPSRLWNQFSINLKGFDGKRKTLRLSIDFNDLVLTGGDRLWIDLGTAGPCELKLGGDATLALDTCPAFEAVDVWADKEMISSKAQYSKQYEFMPWQFTKRDVSLDKPYCYGGPFDILMPAQAVVLVKPDHFVAKYMIRMASLDFRDGRRIDTSTAPLVTLPNPDGVPEWALYMHDYNVKRHSIADWWYPRQNPDGQMGGGWNDDTLFMSFHQADLPLDGNDHARAIIDSVHTKIEYTGLFADGYCRIHPIDRLHTGDFISERYNTFVNNLGQAYAAEREMESAWYSGHPERTPLNYGDGGAFKSSVNVLKWYWGDDVPEEPYVSKPLADITSELRLYTSLFDEYMYYRLTESNVHRDDFTPQGAYETYTYILGGPRGARWDAHLKLAVMWPSGGGPDVSRIVLNADDTSLRAVGYSFDSGTRSLEMRLCRIADGRYRIRILDDPTGDGSGGEALWESEKDLRRFDVVSLPIPPKRPVVIDVQQVEVRQSPALQADLVIDSWNPVYDNGTVTAMVHNLGDSAAEQIVVRLYDGDTVLAEKIITKLDAPTDFVAKRQQVVFTDVPVSNNLRVVVDPDAAIPEILEENNSASVR